jgi:hypothetical protein
VAGELWVSLRLPLRRGNSVIAVWRASCIGLRATLARSRQRFHQGCIAV